LQLHLPFSITIAVILILRIFWRIRSSPPGPEPGTPPEHFVDHAGHMALYAMMVTGYIGTGVNTEFSFVFDIPKFEETRLFTLQVSDSPGMTFRGLEKPSTSFKKT
jgi:cytochrome b561